MKMNHPNIWVTLDEWRDRSDSMEIEHSSKLRALIVYPVSRLLYMVINCWGFVGNFWRNPVTSSDVSVSQKCPWDSLEPDDGLYAHLCQKESKKAWKPPYRLFIVNSLVAFPIDIQNLISTATWTEIHWKDINVKIEAALQGPIWHFCKN